MLLFNHVLLLSELSPFFLHTLLLFISDYQETEEESAAKKRSKHLQRKLDSRKKLAKLDPHIEEQFHTGRLYGESMQPQS